jgi:hypothetical protein
MLRFASVVIDVVVEHCDELAPNRKLSYGRWGFQLSWGRSRIDDARRPLLDIYPVPNFTDDVIEPVLDGIN